ncbi:hypothetical protein B0F90DRAFT_1671392 [Multifurca ochricompacta]|uniref:Fe2OG dioxygenase domain-containing protein n=1 Tax=Multifurca ochricompacta TaxID=376703 RepID=A0AAD4LXS0_9AGAM|nr:hypothetical protein B0F90DRAFT_1671392 [Multifurca ochricompacta]
MDENNRKARTMDPKHFSTPLVPERTELVKIVRDYLLEGEDSKRDIKVGLYKLDVYDKGSFFKPHFRSEDMWTLHLRDDGQEWTFNSGLELAGLHTPTIGYIAFFSDIEHEVAPVISGHRVTLTYNLYFDDDDDDEAMDSTLQGPYRPLATNSRAFRATLEGLLENPEFLADGGTLGFGLRHIYPVLDDRFIDYVYDLLKGSDAVIYKAFKSLGSSRRCTCIMNGSRRRATPPRLRSLTGCSIALILRTRNGMVVWHKEHGASDLEWKNPEKVHWVSPVTRFNEREWYKALELDYVYGDMCLVIRIGKAGERLSYPTVAQLEKERLRDPKTSDFWKKR